MKHRTTTVASIVSSLALSISISGFAGNSDKAIALDLLNEGLIKGVKVILVANLPPFMTCLE